MLMKNFKVGDRVIGRNKSARDWAGTVLEVMADGRTRKFKVRWAYGQVRAVTARGIDLAPLLPHLGPVLNAMEDEMSTASSSSDSTSNSDADDPAWPPAEGAFGGEFRAVLQEVAQVPRSLNLFKTHNLRPWHRSS